MANYAKRYANNEQQDSERYSFTVVELIEVDSVAHVPCFTQEGSHIPYQPNSLNYRAACARLYADWCSDGGMLDDNVIKLFGDYIKRRAPTHSDLLFLLTLRDHVLTVLTESEANR
jgi:hypothetical protein